MVRQMYTRHMRYSMYSENKPVSEPFIIIKKDRSRLAVFMSGLFCGELQ
jgi:hypothetical protein